MNAPKCPGCQGPKPGRMYLCRGCWFTLQPAARRALNRTGDMAAFRLLELHRQLNRDVPLHEIAITP